jgi:hypothetical protein
MKSLDFICGNQGFFEKSGFLGTAKRLAKCKPSSGKAKTKLHF